jgi:hypothetical protein
MPPNTDEGVDLITVDQQARTIVVAQAISRERAVRNESKALRVGSSKRVVGKRIPVICERHNNIKAMLCGQLNH